MLLRKLSNSPLLRPLLEGELDLGALGAARALRRGALSVSAGPRDPGPWTVVAGSPRGCGDLTACPYCREACAGERAVERKDARREEGRLPRTGGAPRGPGICGPAA